MSVRIQADGDGRTQSREQALGQLDRIINGPSQFPRTRHIQCADGTRISVVTGEDLYCSPRNDSGPYHQVEVGTWTSVPESWAPFADYGLGSR